METTTKYHIDKLRSVWHLVRNGKKIIELANACNVTEDVANEMYRQAWDKLGGLNTPNMPRPKVGKRTWPTKGKYVKKTKELLTVYLDKPERTRPPAEYTNNGYLSLLKQHTK